MMQSPDQLPIINASAYVVISSAFTFLLYWLVKTISSSIDRLNKMISANTITLTTMMLILIRHDSRVHTGEGVAQDEETKRVYDDLISHIEGLKSQIKDLERL